VNSNIMPFTVETFRINTDAINQVSQDIRAQVLAIKIWINRRIRHYSKL